MYHQKFELAKNYLQKLLQLAADYKYGDASLAYCKTLLALQDTETAQLELRQHVKIWNHPEAYILLGRILIQRDNLQEARNYLETIITRVKGSTHFHYKRNRRFIGQAEKILREICKS
ncbi:tetratricopeptide repeat protein [Scytonema millei]|uniref:Tetratricopeptide repeat protein n=1 Tax=Scytonema millei VB511283 TaxID=1245923 RepID=A0A9X5E3U4_9CYAN|nr:tetratricopeptide repeat protein [Scytonema millei]NHC34751.1 tetratricopeptide repeat protein [Scytonema millei VB511283]